MPYILTLIALIAVLLWFPASRDGTLRTIRPLTDIAVSVRHDAPALVSDSFRRGTSFIRTKTMELLRKELHQTVDDIVR